jgi:hypothetical protein
MKNASALEEHSQYTTVMLIIARVELRKEMHSIQFTAKFVKKMESISTSHY